MWDNNKEGNRIFGQRKCTTTSFIAFAGKPKYRREYLLETNVNDNIFQWVFGFPCKLSKAFGASQDQADPREGKKLTFQAIPLQFFVKDIVSISLGKPKTGFGIS
jgi:hypothetical protein